MKGMEVKQSFLLALFLFSELLHPRLQELPKAGHWVHADDPEGLIRLVVEFLGEPPAHP